MLRILVPFDGSENAGRALDYAVKFAGNSKDPVELHLLNVQLPVVSGDVRMFVGHDAIAAYYRDSGEQVLAAGRQKLARAGTVHVEHIGVGQAAETIAAYVADRQCGQVIMGTRGLGTVSGLLLGSVATKVLHLVTVPVTLVR